MSATDSHRDDKTDPAPALPYTDRRDELLWAINVVLTNRFGQCRDEPAIRAWLQEYDAYRIASAQGGESLVAFCVRERIGKLERELAAAMKLVNIWSSAFAESATSETAPLIEALKRITEWGYDEPNSALIARVALKKADPQAGVSAPGDARIHSGDSPKPAASAPCVADAISGQSEAFKILNYAFTLLETNKSAELMIEYLRAAFERLRAAKRGYERKEP